jgi:hypothetical protein
VVRSPARVTRVSSCSGADMLKSLWRILRTLSTDIPTSANISWMLFPRSLRTTLRTRLMSSSFVDVECRPSLTIARPSRKCLHGHHENVYGTRKPAFPSLSPYRTLLQGFVMSLKEIYLAKHNIS